MEAIARSSGVSLATVSLVLRDKPGINGETRRRVLETARELGYQRRTPVGPMHIPGLKQLGLVIKARPHDVPQDNQFYSQVIAGVESACRKHNVNLLYAALPINEDNHAVEVPRLFRDPQVDGVLLVGAFADATIAGLVESKSLPLVLVDAYTQSNVSGSYDSVISDNVGGAFEVVRCLILKGHRHIGLVGSLPNGYPSINDRRAGYLRALAEHGIAETYFADCHLHLDEAREATLTLLRHHPQVTAVFGCNDLAAIGALRAARICGRELPDQLSIIGFDDIDLASHVMPPLTTMQVDKLTMGRIAVQLLANRIEFPEAATMTVVLRPRLIERESVVASITH